MSISKEIFRSRFAADGAFLSFMHKSLWWPYWSPYDDTLQTPPGPEGSNGSDGFGRQGVADVGYHQFP